VNSKPHGGAWPEQQEPRWSPLDEHLLHTCDIVADVVEGRLDLRPLVPTTARLARGDRALVVGPADRYTYRAVGDGSYQHSTFVAFGSPLFLAGSLAASAIGNASRRRAAEFAAQPRWVPDGRAELTVTRWAAFHGLPAAPLALPWENVQSVDLAGPDQLVTGFTGLGGLSYLVLFHTPWASLMFALAALTSFPAHPRLLNGGWLPPEFERHCAYQGRSCRPARQLLAQAAREL
jgi:hypothetical protein